MGKKQKAEKPVYVEVAPKFEDWMNSFVELHGMYCFKDDLEWGFDLLCFCDREVTIPDITNTINKCVVSSEMELPEATKYGYAMPFNHDLDSISTSSLFPEWIFIKWQAIVKSCSWYSVTTLRHRMAPRHTSHFRTAWHFGNIMENDHALIIIILLCHCQHVPPRLGRNSYNGTLKFSCDGQMSCAKLPAILAINDNFEVSF